LLLAIFSLLKNNEENISSLTAFVNNFGRVNCIFAKTKQKDICR